MWKNIIRKSVSVIFKGISIVSILGLLYAIGALITSSIPINTTGLGEPAQHSIFLVSNGVHIDIVLPEGAVPSKWKDQMPQKMANATHYGFGWGDKGFYLDTPDWESLSVSTMLNAVLWPSETTMHVSCYGKPNQADEHVSCIRFTDSQYGVLLADIQAGFRTSGSGEWEIIKDESYGQRDAFFEAKGRYHAFNTCNSWVGGRMKKCGVRSPLWSPLPSPIIRQAKLSSASCSSQ